jgi:hypothetical protein
MELHTGLLNLSKAKSMDDYGMKPAPETDYSRVDIVCSVNMMFVNDLQIAW